MKSFEDLERARINIHDVEEFDADVDGICDVIKSKDLRYCVAALCAAMINSGMRNGADIREFKSVVESIVEGYETVLTFLEKEKNESEIY